ncbi:hypothetical protein GC174_15105 [bacterium]|nr:hypothetical protein [bacterium]
MKFAEFGDFPSLFIQSGEDKSQLFGINMARQARHFVLRTTGGCLLEPEYIKGLKMLEYALSGRDRAGRQRPGREKFSGFGLFGGTRVLQLQDPSRIIYGITEVLPSIRRYCPEAVMLGVLAKVGHMRYSPYGLIVSESEEDSLFAVINPDQSSCVILQPSSDQRASWDDEWKECVRIVDALSEMGWQALLVVYNGGPVTEREARTWARLSRDNPDFWRVLIVKGSGRVADQLACDQSFIDEHPGVYLCENDLDQMRASLTKLGALV